MIRRAAILAAAMLAAPLWGRETDARITSHFFQPGEVVTVHGRSNIQSTITFAPDERIENVAIGDSNAWQVTPNKRANLLFVKPMQPRARTNMTVVTDQRTYLFDLVAAPGGAPLYMLSFTYPAPPPPPPAAPAAVPEAAVLAEPVVPPDPTPEALLAGNPADLNFGWQPSGARQLLPSRSFDDGRSVYLAWSKDVALPAILVREPNGIEAPVNYTVKGDYIVVDGVPAQLVLRSGKRMATLTASARGASAPSARSAEPTAQQAAAISAAEGRTRRLLPQTASNRP